MKKSMKITMKTTNIASMRAGMTNGAEAPVPI